ncbi:hypothetical protein Ahy_A10g048173 isoform A [Arachis hypogaea]|uniref:Uncharacterized protein n=1 Tax=Arachis hypogaea TaxID=3818 RepID=A0A445B4G6_ARAHY|nr:hypothetical protein Ahy_A10g048173 isoform A [Arachis hypogaea]
MTIYNNLKFTYNELNKRITESRRLSFLGMETLKYHPSKNLGNVEKSLISFNPLSIQPSTLPSSISLYAAVNSSPLSLCLDGSTCCRCAIDSTSLRRSISFWILFCSRRSSSVARRSSSSLCFAPLSLCLDLPLLRRVWKLRRSLLYLSSLSLFACVTVSSVVAVTPLPPHRRHWGIFN